MILDGHRKSARLFCLGIFDGKVIKFCKGELTFDELPFPVPSLSEMKDTMSEKR